MADAAVTPVYRHTQPGHVMRIALGAGILFVMGLWLVIRSSGSPPVTNWIMGSTLVVPAVCVALFWSLTVEIAGGFVVARFGPGLIRLRFPLRDIESCEPVTNCWCHGWGIHWTPRGWLYNVSGRYSVQIRMRSGKTALIGTDEPEALVAAIRDAMAAERLAGCGNTSAPG